MTLHHLSHREIIGIVLQPTLGSPVDPVTHLVPVTSFSASENYEQILDNGRRGPDSMDFGAVQGVKHVEITIEGAIQMNGTTGSAIGFFLRSILGTGAAGASGPYWTPVQISTDAVYKHYRYLGTTKEYLTIQHFDGLSTSGFREFEGCRCTELVIRWNSGEGNLTYTATLIGADFTKETDTMADLSAQDITQEDLIPGWRAAVTINNATNARLISSEWTMRRSASRVYTGTNQQQYRDLYLGPLEATVAMVFDYNDVAELDLFKAGTQIEVTNLFEYGTTTTLRGFGIASLVTSLLEAPAEIDSSSEQLTLALGGRCIYTTSDGPLSTDKSDTNAQNGPIEVLTEEKQIAGY